MSALDPQQMILDRLESIHSDLSDFRTETNNNFSSLQQRTTALETQTSPFFQVDGGRETKINDRLSSLEKSRNWGLGAVAAITAGGHFLLHKLGF